MKALSCLLLIVAIYISSAGSAFAQWACIRGETPVVIQGSIVGGDMLQVGRITRDSKPSTCLGDTATAENGIFLRRDTHNLVNPYNETVCVRVEVDFTGCAGNQTQSVAYSTFNALAPETNVLGDMGYSTIGKGSYSFSVGPNASFAVGVNELEQNTGCPNYNLKVTYLRNCRQAGTDITNDGQADPTVYRKTQDQGSVWYTWDSETSQPAIRSFGAYEDIPTGGNDYTGDGKTDLSVYRPSSHTWYYGTSQESPGTNFVGIPWGTGSDKPVPGDFDADGKNDIAVYRPTEGRFYILRSSDGSMQSHQWGALNDQPVSGDFDGDGATDIAITRLVTNTTQWWILKSNFRYGFHSGHVWGASSDRPVPGDYDGDGKTDIATFRPSTGTFYVYRSSDGQMEAAQWGQNGDVPQPADYDGDMKQDYAVYRPSTGIWYIFNSGTGTVRYVNWGAQYDQPMTTAYKIQGATPPLSVAQQ